MGDGGDQSAPGAAVNRTRVFFIEMMGVPGTYDASVYDHFADKDDEGEWFRKRYAHLDVVIETRNVCVGEPLPLPAEFDGLVLAGTYNSVHDRTDWQRRVLDWFPEIRASGKPLLGVCGSHQLLGHYFGSEVTAVQGGPCAGTFATSLTPSAAASPLMRGIADGDSFHYANSEQLAEVPRGASLLAFSDVVPVAALDFGGHWYSTQFHPEASAESLGTIWRNTRPALRQNYHDGDAGDRLVENFMRIVHRARTTGVTGPDDPPSQRR